MDAALRVSRPTGPAVGETACAQAGVEIAETIVTTMRKFRRFMLSPVFPPAALDIRYECA
jgi:hypothetical protein